MKITSLGPDWTKTYSTIQAIEADLSIKFCGPGFYLTSRDTLLIVPVTLEGSTRDSIWNYTQPFGTQYRVLVTNSPFQHTLYAALAAVAPTRQDTRHEEAIKEETDTKKRIFFQDLTDRLANLKQELPQGTTHDPSRAIRG